MNRRTFFRILGGMVGVAVTGPVLARKPYLIDLTAWFDSTTNTAYPVENSGLGVPGPTYEYCWMNLGGTPTPRHNDLTLMRREYRPK